MRSHESLCATRNAEQTSIRQPRAGKGLLILEPNLTLSLKTYTDIGEFTPSRDTIAPALQKRMGVLTCCAWACGIAAYGQLQKGRQILRPPDVGFRAYERQRREWSLLVFKHLL
jgi:hypothetical protein